ncbi:hypothetical protein CAXC1_220028 [Candidatus Xenohaliotis californiensis]|uniref:PD-(D/E)XK endonuclease-like domain-containing protein n=1 Tax=Candidatus Xenohaliotis californiensis TaxID=84677 RepID=A0ABP0EVX5_9RICK|nr:hypothetical protein CAXC1_220028 [Candidatus Xenohaliotis californiensis]
MMFKLSNDMVHLDGFASIVEAGLLFQQLEWVWNVVSRKYIDQKICIAVCDNSVARAAYEYFCTKTSMIAMAYNSCLSSPEMIFFSLILEFTEIGWSSTSLLSLLKSQYCSFGFASDIVYNCVLFLEDEILRSYAPAYSTKQLICWVEDYKGKVVKPKYFTNFFSKLVNTLKYIESWRVGDLSLDVLWLNHLKIVSVIAGSNSWYKLNSNFVDFVAEGCRSFTVNESISFTEYKSLISRSMHNFNPPIITDNDWLTVCGLRHAGSVYADIFFVLNLCDENLFTGSAWPAILDKRAIKNLGFTTLEDVINLEYLLSLIHSGKLYILCKSLSMVSVLQHSIVDIQVTKAFTNVERCSHYIAPSPSPPLHMRPVELSVSKLQSLLNNPYGFYVENILGLHRKLKIDLDVDNNVNIGTIAHKLIDMVVSKKVVLDADSVKRISREMIVDLLGTNLVLPKVDFSIIPLLQKIICDFIKMHQKRLQGNINVFGEVDGAISFFIKGKKVAIKVRCDRIEVDRDSGLVKIFDYKTGSIPAMKDCRAGMELQLSIAALAALDGGFSNIGEIAGIEELSYWDLRRNKLQPVKSIGCLDNMLDTIRNNIKCFLADYLNKDSGFYVKPRINRRYCITEHDNLSRIDEEGY